MGFTSSSFVGCQSIGLRRWSNFFELPSFHLRKTVQKMKIPPMDATVAMRMVRTLLFFLAVAPVIAGAAVGAASTV